MLQGENSYGGEIDSNIKLVFSKSKDGTGSMSSFNSGDYIFGVLKFPEKANDYLYSNHSIMAGGYTPWVALHLQLEVFKEGAKVCSIPQHTYVLVKDYEKENMILDLLGSADEATTLYCGDRKGELSMSPLPLNRLVYLGMLSGSGKYVVKLKISFVKEYLSPKDWPCVESNFDFSLNQSDIEKLGQNYFQAKSKLAPGEFVFSNQPFEKGINRVPKDAFTSSDFIYARLDLPTDAVDFFKLPQKAKNPSSLRYRITVYKDGERVQWGQWFYLRLTDVDRKSNSLYLDVLPQPTVATSILAMVPEFNQGILAAPMASILTNQQHFPEEGKYLVQVLIAYPTYDPYSPETPNTEDKWIRCSGEFNMEFKVNDVVKLNSQITESNRLVKENAEKKLIEERGLPNEWTISGNKIVCGYTQEQLNQLLTKRLEAGAKVIRPIVFEQKDPMWIVEKNDLDIPILKYHNQTFGFFVLVGGHYYYMEGYLAQTYEGGGKYGTVYLEWYRKDEIGAKFIEPQLK